MKKLLHLIKNNNTEDFEDNGLDYFGDGGYAGD